MGLASKLQAAQTAQPPQNYQQYPQAPPPSGPPPAQQQPYQSQQYQQQPYAQQQPYVQQQPYGQQPQSQQYQQPQQYQPQQFTQPQYTQPQYTQPPPPSVDPRQIESVLQQCVQDQNLSAFYQPGSLGPIAQQIARSGALEKAAAMFKLPVESAVNLVKLALFDTCLLLDDSGSMAFSKWQGERLDDLNMIVSRVSSVASLYDADGIAVRFLNSNKQGNNINTEYAAIDLLKGIEYKYQTPLGGALDAKILKPMVVGPASNGTLKKPVLVIIVTDGAPSDGDLITRVIKDANSKLKRTRYGADALSIQIAQVGNDLEAQEFLSKIDADPTIGDLVDCTSNYEVEADEMMRKTGRELTPDGWLIKLLMGGIDSSYDQQDEAAHHGGVPGGAAHKKTSKFKSLFKGKT